MGVKLLADPAVRTAAEVLLVADPAVLAAGERVAGMKLPVQRVAGAGAAMPGGNPVVNRIAWLADDALGGAVPPNAQPTTEAGRAALRAAFELNVRMAGHTR